MEPDLTNYAESSSTQLDQFLKADPYDEPLSGHSQQVFSRIRRQNSAFFAVDGTGQPHHLFGRKRRSDSWRVVPHRPVSVIDLASDGHNWILRS